VAKCEFLLVFYNDLSSSVINTLTAPAHRIDISCPTHGTVWQRENKGYTVLPTHGHM